MMGNSWLCMKFEFAFFAGHGIFDQGSSAFFSCFLFWPSPYATSCFVLHIFRMRFPNGIFMFCEPEGF